MQGTGLYFPVCAFPFSFMALVLFFTKKHIKHLETRIYKVIIVLNFIGLILEMLCTYASYIYSLYPIISDIIYKSYLLYLISWSSTFAYYIYCVSREETQYNKGRYKFFAIYYIIIILLLSILPIEVVVENNFQTRYTKGPAVQLVYLVSAVSMILMAYFILKNIKKFNSKKYIPVYLFFLLGGISTAIQYFRPEILLSTYVETLVTVIMYFTIENPDVKMIELERQVAESAKAASEAKTAFLSSMSHELRTPLNAIVGLSEDIMAYKDQVPLEVREDSEDIVNASDTLLEIVGNILDINKIEGGKLELMEVDYNPKHEFESIVKIMRTKVKEKPLEFNTYIDEELPEALFGDRLRIKQVINNFLSNAIKYTDEGQIDFSVNWISQIETLQIIVRDTGRGVKQEDMDKLFEKFERLQVEKVSSVQGTGLGLSITKSLVELMGGQINVQSEFGKGSTFSVTIPQKIGDVSKLEQLDTEKKARAASDYTGKKILVVDDNSLNIKVLKKALKPFNFEIDECYDGKAAIEKINKNKYDIVLMDIMMPGMGGEEVLAKLKENPEFNTPIIALTADATTGAKEKYLADGFVDYLAKPFTRDIIAQKLEKILK